ncbi:hypothetical protein ACFE04_007374 [Oxalis oulophora]
MVVQPGGHIIYDFRVFERKIYSEGLETLLLASLTCFLATWQQGRAGNWRACAVARLHQLKADSRPVQGSLTDRPWPDLAWEPATLLSISSARCHEYCSQLPSFTLLSESTMVQAMPNLIVATYPIKESSRT